MNEKKCSIFGLETSYLETRGKDGLPILILHGWGSSFNSWRKVAEVLEEAGKKVLVPDLPGFGQTPEPPSPWGIEEYIKFIRAFLKELGIKKCVLAGHSFGGQIAIAFAASHLNELTALILMSPARIARRKKVKIKIWSIFTKAGSVIFLLPSLCFLKPLVRKIWYVLSGERDYYRASPRMQQVMKRALEEKVTEKLSDIQAPTLILWGENDLATPLEDGYIIHKNIRDSRLQIIKGAGHAINLERSEEVAQSILSFLKDHTL